MIAHTARVGVWEREIANALHVALLQARISRVALLYRLASLEVECHNTHTRDPLAQSGKVQLTWRSDVAVDKLLRSLGEGSHRGEKGGWEEGGLHAVLEHAVCRLCDAYVCRRLVALHLPPHLGFGIALLQRTHLCLGIALSIRGSELCIQG